VDTQAPHPDQIHMSLACMLPDIFPPLVRDLMSGTEGAAAPTTAVPRPPDTVQPATSTAARSIRSSTLLTPFFLIHRFHSISFTRAQGIPKYKIGFVLFVPYYCQSRLHLRSPGKGVPLRAGLVLRWSCLPVPGRTKATTVAPTYTAPLQAGALSHRMMRPKEAPTFSLLARSLMASSAT
jgi:hypothetical protein